MIMYDYIYIDMLYTYTAVFLLFCFSSLNVSRGPQRSPGWPVSSIAQLQGG